MNVKIELQDIEALEMAVMLQAVGEHLSELGNENNALYAGVQVLRDKLMEAVVKQVPNPRFEFILNR